MTVSNQFGVDRVIISALIAGIEAICYTILDLRFSQL
jgi:hypothetical protein